MNIIKLKGLVLREANSGEADKIITVLTKEKGKKVIAAKGARRPRSPYIAGTQQFSYCDFIIYDNKNIANLNQLEIIETFHNIRSNLFKLSYGAYFMELLENVSMEDVASEELLKLTLKTLQILNRTEYNFKLLCIIYEIRIMKLIGYMPETTQCVNCGGKLKDNIYFGANAGGILCSNCRNISRKPIKISSGSLYAIQYILSVDLLELFKFSVSEQVLYELSNITKQYICEHIDHKFRTLEFLEQLY